MTAILGFQGSWDMGHRKGELTAGDLTYVIVGAFRYVYNNLGYGFLESVYAAALERVLVKRGRTVAREVRVPVWFEGEIVAFQRLDMVVDDTVVVEIKSTRTLHNDAMRQLRNYLKATGLPVGLLLHFAPTGAKVTRRTGDLIPGIPGIPKSQSSK